MSNAPYQRYPAYKDSGVEWLGEIPVGWEVRRLKYVADEPIKNGVGEAGAFDNPDWPRYIRITDLDGPRSLRKDTFKSLPPEVARGASFEVGDLLLAAVGATFGKSYLHAHDIGMACYAGYLVRFSPGQSLEPSFAAYWTESSVYWALVNSRVVQATIQNFSATKYRDLAMPVPTLPEQRAIAAFLDRETAEIDVLIAKKERLIELLQEQRASVITRAVTKGLDPDVPLKDSGVEWLGKISAHWEAKRIKFVGRVGNGSTPSRENPEYWGGEYPWLNSSVVNLREVCEGSDFVTELALAECHLPRVTPPAVLVGITGEGRTRGMATLLRIEATLSQHLAYIKPTVGHDVNYIGYAFESAYQLLRDESGRGGSTKGALTCEQLGELVIPAPPEPEQRAIAAFLDEQTSKLDALIAKVREAIRHLTELRTALISAAVTGKIDVRSEVA